MEPHDKELHSGLYTADTYQSLFVSFIGYMYSFYAFSSNLIQQLDVAGGLEHHWEQVSQA
jgi:hypothetical protein